jgi:hypothetical protein
MNEVVATLVPKFEVVKTVAANGIPVSIKDGVPAINVHPLVVVRN